MPKFPTHYNTCSNCPPSHCVHAASHPDKCCHCMCHSSFLIPTEASFMAYNNLCLPSGFSSWYTVDFMQPHRKKSNGFNAGERAGQATGPFVSNPPSLEMFVQELRNLSADMWRCPAMLEVLSFSYRKRRILWITTSSIFHKVSVIRSCHNFPRWHAVQSGNCLMLHTTC